MKTCTCICTCSGLVILLASNMLTTFSKFKTEYTFHHYIHVMYTCCLSWMQKIIILTFKKGSV